MKKPSEKLVFSKNLQARNRIIMPPMDTLMADKGRANDFHVQHYGARAYGGVGTIIVESTAVAVEGRIRERDLGLWNDAQIAPMKRVTDVVKQAGALVGVQLNHAGAKSEARDLTVFGTTNHYSYLALPHFRLMTAKDLPKLVDHFVKAALRAKKAGFDFVELHGAHGYLINELLHPVLNEVFPAHDVLERAAFLFEIIDRIKKDVQIPVGIRLSVTDHDVNGIDVDYYVPLIKKLSPHLIYFNVSSGETISRARTNELIAAAGTRMFRIPLAQQVKALTDKVVFTGGNVSSKNDVIDILDAGIDAVYVGRELLFNPHFVITDILENEELDPKIYHWNSNLWHNHASYLLMMRQLKLK